MKKPIVAFLLSFLLPGAGLAYLGQWKLGFINLGIVLLIGAIAAALIPEESFDQYSRYIAIACSGGSGGFAQTIAAQLNAKAKTERASDA